MMSSMTHMAYYLIDLFFETEVSEPTSGRDTMHTQSYDIDLVRTVPSFNRYYVFPFQFLRCYETHHLGPSPATSTASSLPPAQLQRDVDSVSHLVEEGRTKVKEIRGNLRNLEATSQRLHAQVRF